MHALNRSMIAECFEVVVTADETRQSKPHPEGYLRVLEALNLPEARRVLVFDDSEVGLTAASAAGMRCVRVNHRSSHRIDGTSSGFGPTTMDELRHLLG